MINGLRCLTALRSVYPVLRTGREARCDFDAFNHHDGCGANSKNDHQQTHTEHAMIGIVIVTHGRLADEFRAALEHVVGPQQQLATVSIGPEDPGEPCRQHILEKIRSVDTGEGTVVLTDMFGGTPSNLAISVMDASNIEVIAGVNLPMLIKLTSVREERQLADAVDAAKEAGRKYISVASQVLAGDG
jgi:PTS system mannose-specific IIA component